MPELERKEYTEVAALDTVPKDYFSGNQSIERIRFRGLHFVSWKFRESLIKSSEFVHCTFEDCIFDRMDLQRVWFRKCAFQRCLFSPDFRFINGQFEQCRINDSEFPQAFIQYVKWIGSELFKVDFRQLKAKSIAFPESSLVDVTFEGASITRGDFRTVPNLQRRTFYDVKVEDCDFDWNEAFIIMQFDDARTNELYQYGIEPVLKELGIECKRVDRYEFRGRITDEILQNIVTSKVVVAECSATNKNVFFEVGYALGRNKDVIFCVDKAENIPFDLKDFKFIIHGNSIDELRKHLLPRVRFMLGLK